MRDASRSELDAYRALEMAKGGTELQTIFKTTGGYRQSVVDQKNKAGKLKVSPRPSKP